MKHGIIDNYAFIFFGELLGLENQKISKQGPPIFCLRRLFFFFSMSSRLSTYAWNWESGEGGICSYILVPPNLIENDHNFVFFAIKYQFNKSLNHVCFEKRDEFSFKIQKLFVPWGWLKTQLCLLCPLPRM